MRQGMLIPILIGACLHSAAQPVLITVDAANITGDLPWIWNDYHETHLRYGYGNPFFVTGPHVQFHDDPAFIAVMAQIRPRFLRVTNYMFENPPTPDHVSADTTVLKQLPEEFYDGPNTLAGADDPANYDFTYIDSLVATVRSYGSEPFLNLSFTPFPLAANKAPSGSVLWDNTVRNGPASDPMVYGRVMYHFVKHCYDELGVTWFEGWNEPDPFLGPFFWTGTMQQLFDMYNAMANEIEADPALAPNIHLGCCGFTFNFFLTAFATQFMAAAEQADTRMDFIGYHPYSIGTPSGYDPGRTVIAAALRDLYRPNAELVNTEWGLLGGVDREQWADLDYGLAKVRSMIGMLDEGVEIATQAVLTDIFDDTSSTCCPGVVQLWPQVAIKNSTRPLIAMNMVRTATHRVGASSTDSAVVAGWTPGMDTLWVVATADTGIAPVQVQLSIADLPWASARIERFELTETTIDVWNGPTLVEDDVQTDVWGDTLVHTVDQGSGRLIIWRVTEDQGMSVASSGTPGAFALFPQPAEDLVQVDLGMHGKGTLMLKDAAGRTARTWAITGQSMLLDLSEVPAGAYLLSWNGPVRKITTRLLKH